MSGTAFLLVHGGFHGAWCWDRLLPLLRSASHAVDAMDLPYPAEVHADSSTLLTGWASQVSDRAARYDAPVILVGHSRGGLIISQAAEWFPDRFAGLVYCAALLAEDGETGADVRSRLDHPSSTPPKAIATIDGMLAVDPASAASAFYARCSPEDAAWAISRLSCETPAGLRIAPQLTAEHYGQVPRGAVECTADRILPVSLQRAMRASQPCRQVETLACDHSPFLSDPKGLCAALIAIAAGFARS